NPGYAARLACSTPTRVAYKSNSPYSAHFRRFTIYDLRFTHNQQMLADVALIGGTGIGDVLSTEPGQALCVPTKFGPMRGRIIDKGFKLLLLQRHSAGHKVPPHMVNYRAVAEGLRLIGMKWCLSSAAVGSLRRDWPAGT